MTIQYIALKLVIIMTKLKNLAKNTLKNVCTQIANQNSTSKSIRFYHEVPVPKELKKSQK